MRSKYRGLLVYQLASLTLRRHSSCFVDGELRPGSQVLGCTTAWVEGDLLLLCMPKITTRKSFRADEL